MNKDNVVEIVDKLWEEKVIPGLSDFIKIPAVSPAYDKDWHASGYLMQAATTMANWAAQQGIPGLTTEILKIGDRTPMLLVEVPGDCDRTVLFYGHFDKMPPSDGWDDGLGPWQPVIKDGRLYGRGAVDDGYSLYSSIAAIKAVQLQNKKHPRCVILLEGTEESGSYDLKTYMGQLEAKIGAPELVVCLDVCALDYERLWCTTSLRGIIVADLKIKLLERSLHSGVGGGVVPDISRVLRMLLERVENHNSGEFLLKSFNVDIPNHYVTNTKGVAAILQERTYCDLPLHDGVQPVTSDVSELLINRTWRPALSITGMSGFPAHHTAASAMVPEIGVRLSFRLPPTANTDGCINELREVLTKNPPHGVKLDLAVSNIVSGWASPMLDPWLQKVLAESSRRYFGNDVAYLGEGGGIGFVATMSNTFPKAQFLLTGLVGADSGAHGPNENLHILAAKKLTCSMAYLLAESI